MGDGTEPLDPNERVYRRVIAGRHYKPGRKPEPLSPRAFAARPVDDIGISFVRAKYVSGPEEAAALGATGYDYDVIEMRAGDLAREGIKIVPDPIAGECVGHAVSPAINAQNANDPDVLAMMEAARRLPFTPHGPFPGKAPPKASQTANPSNPSDASAPST
jgi:hypothetical protein